MEWISIIQIIFGGGVVAGIVEVCAAIRHRKADTVKGSHLVSTGYLHWAYEYVTYIDWIIKNHMSDFNDVAFVGDDAYNSTGTDSEEESDE